MNDDKPFFVRSENDMKSLAKWLSDRRFNCGGFCANDKKGNPMVSIGYDWKPESDWSMPEKRGLIVVIAKKQLGKVEALVNRMAQQ